MEDAIDWAIANEFYYLDFNADSGPNHMESWNRDRMAAVRDTCEMNGISIGLHTLSAVNIAETSPYVSSAVDEYLRASIDLANGLGCQWTVVHAGYHFTGDVPARTKASLERLQRIAKYAADTGARILLENLNYEPEHAEIHYMAHTVEECSAYFDAIPADRLGWAFTVNHSHLVPEGVGGFIDAFGIERCMWGTGYPGYHRVEHGWPSLADELKIVREAFDWLTDESRSLLLGDNAARVWGLS